MPPAAMDARSGLVSASGWVITLRPSRRACGWATLPTAATDHAPTWQRCMPSGTNTSSRSNWSYGLPPARAATSPATTYIRLS